MLTVWLLIIYMHVKYSFKHFIIVYDDISIKVNFVINMLFQATHFKTICENL